MIEFIGSIHEDKELICSDQEVFILGTGQFIKKIYRNLSRCGRKGSMKAVACEEKNRLAEIVHEIPIISLDKIKPDSMICICEEDTYAMGKVTMLPDAGKVHQVQLNKDSELWGTEYGGFYIPKSFQTNPGFIVYSFGIGEDLSFSEEAIARGGSIYAFDPTPKSMKFVENHRLNGHPRFHFFPYGLAARNGKAAFYLPINEEYVSGSVIQHKTVSRENRIEVEMKTIRSIMRELKHHTVDIIKMDIEGAEFQVVEDMMNPRLEPVDFKVLCLETHERFFEDKLIGDKLYGTMGENKFFDLYGTGMEPTFIKCEV